MEATVPLKGFIGVRIFSKAKVCRVIDLRDQSLWPAVASRFALEQFGVSGFKLVKITALRNATSIE